MIISARMRNCNVENDFDGDFDEHGIAISIAIDFKSTEASDTMEGTLES